jgi:hypothetical protein
VTALEFRTMCCRVGDNMVVLSEPFSEDGCGCINFGNTEGVGSGVPANSGIQRG